MDFVSTEPNADLNSRVNNPEYEAAKKRVKYLETMIKRIIVRSESFSYAEETDRDIINGMVNIAEEALGGR